MEISVMRNCRDQDLQAAAKIAQNSFYRAGLFNPSVSQRPFPAFPWCSSLRDSC